MTRPPRFVWVVVLVALAGALLLSVVVWQAVAIRNEEERRDCARAIASREDSRAMWLYLIDTANSDPERVEKFAKKLDELLPELTCEGGNWVPDHDDERDG